MHFYPDKNIPNTYYRQIVRESTVLYCKICVLLRLAAFLSVYLCSMMRLAKYHNLAFRHLR